MRILRAMARLVAPPCCLLCGGEGQDTGETFGLDLCPHCEAACPRAEPEPPPFETAFCLFRYEDPVDELIVRLKFQHDIAAARVLGTLLARAYAESNRPLPDCLVPMPLHPSRYRERGFCQTTLVAGHAARRLRTPAGRRLQVRPDLLRRVRGGRPQSSLGAGERARNLVGAFHSPRGRPVPRHVALLDDVLTTGSTARAAINALQAAGVARVDLWCCARTLREDGA
jgi:ComF family protein